MKFTVNKSGFLRVLSVAQEVINNKSPISVLSNVLIQTDKDKLILKCTNSTVSASTFINADVSEEGETTVFCDKLISIISALPDGDIEVEKKDIELTIKPVGKKIKFKIKSLAADKFPEINKFNENGAFNVSAKDFKEMIRQTSFAVADDVNRYFLTGVYFTKHEDKPVFVATDGRRMSFCWYSDVLPDFKPAIIPVKILSLIDKIAPSEGEFTINVTDKEFFFKGFGFELSSLLIDGQYPAWQKVLPDMLDQTITVSKKDLESAIKRISIMTEKSGRIHLVFDENKMIVSSPDTEIGNSKEEIAAVYQKAKAEIALNVTYLNDVLKVIDSNDISLDFKFNQENAVKSAILVRTAGEEKTNYTHVIMPMTF